MRGISSHKSVFCCLLELNCISQGWRPAASSRLWMCHLLWGGDLHNNFVCLFVQSGGRWWWCRYREMVLLFSDGLYTYWCWLVSLRWILHIFSCHWHDPCPNFGGPLTFSLVLGIILVLILTCCRTRSPGLFPTILGCRTGTGCRPGTL